MQQSNSTLIYSAYLSACLSACPPACLPKKSLVTLSLLLLTSLSSLANDTAGENASILETATTDSSNATSVLERTALPPQQIHMSSLAAALDPSEIVWLNDVQEEQNQKEQSEENTKALNEQDDERFISLYRPALQPAQMAVILMPDSIHKLAQKGLMRQLYTELPMTGWSTLHIGLPEVSNATEIFEAEESTEDKNETVAASRIATSIQFLLDKGIRSTALVAENYSAQRAITASITQADATSGLVLWRVEKAQLPLSQLQALAKSQITVLDIVNHDIGKSEKAERIRKFHLAGFAQNYRLITTPQGEAGIKHTERRVRDWLETRFKKF